MQKITTSAPGKLLLFGDHAVIYGHPCIVTAINQRVFVTVEKRDDDLFVVRAPDLQINHYQKKISQLGQGKIPKEVQFLETVLTLFCQRAPQTKGLTATTKNDFSSQYGFGSSSAVSVAFAFALAKLLQVSFSFEELFELVYQAIIQVQGVGSGFDVATAIWGGTIYYVTPAKIILPLKIAKIPLAVGYTGKKVSTALVVKEVATAKAKDSARIERLFTRSTQIVEPAKEALVKADWPLVGHLMNQNQTMLAELDVSSPELFRLINAAKTAGAYGAKLSGAGKGDCMIAIAEEDKLATINLAIQAAQGIPLSVQTHAEGVRIEKENHV